MSDSDHTICELCGVECECTKHHLVPKVRAKNKYKAIKDDDFNIIWICRQCHDAVHAAYTENQLRDLYNTREKLLESPEVKKFIEWRKKHPEFNGHAKMSNARKHR